MKPINLVIIGNGMYVCGRGTEGYGTVLPAVLQRAKHADIGDIYIAGTDPKGATEAKEKVRALSEKMGRSLRIRYFPETKKADADCYRDAIRQIPKPACAIVVVPDELHRKVAGDAVGSGLHTLVVKPLAPTVREVRELIALQTRRGVYGAVEFHKRFDHANIKLKDAIDKGLIGCPLYFLVEYSQRKIVPTKYFKKWVETTNIFQYLGIHYVDIIYFVTKAIPKRAMALGQKGFLANKGINTYDAVEAIVEWRMPEGAKFVSHILTNWVDPESSSAMSDQKIKAIGTMGRFESDQKQRGITIVTDDKGIEEPNPYFSAEYGSKKDIDYRGYGIDSITQFLDDVTAVEEGSVKINDLEKTRPTFSQAIVPTKVLEAVNKSLKYNGKWVNID